MRKVTVTEKDGLWKVEIKGGYFTKRDLILIGRAMIVEARVSNKALKVEEVKAANERKTSVETLQKAPGKETGNVPR
jgi:hypothetical protein